MSAIKTAAQELREAAVLMRERAEAATPGPWRESPQDENRYAAVVADSVPAGRSSRDRQDEIGYYGGHLVGESIRRRDRHHIASWHPGVALAVADWLDYVALHMRWRDDHPADGMDMPMGVVSSALAVARAYRGQS